jgi:hypothetical protein
MNLKTTTQIAIETGCWDQDHNLFLCGVDGLQHINDTLHFAIKNNDINNTNHTFKNVFGFDCKFFYTIEQMNNGEVVRYERGLGNLYEHNDKVYLKRNPMIGGKNSRDLYYDKTVCTQFQCDDCSHIVVTSSYPPTYIECLTDKNSIITSIESFIPHSFIVEENSIVGRLDGDVESISFKNKAFIDLISDALCKYTKQLVLKTSKLDVKKISTPVLQINPSTSPPAKDGCIYYDEVEKSLKFYDGSKWRTLVFKDDE